MTQSRIHLVRHGEVHNPGGVLYGRLPGYHLSEPGVRMAALAARELHREGREISRIISSPLERALESAEPIAQPLSLPVHASDHLTEASSRLEGEHYSVSLRIIGKPRAWRHLVNPFRPSWGEPFTAVAHRMLAAMSDAKDLDGDVVMVSHQLPIWLLHRHAIGKPLVHDPRRRRCALSSITTFEWLDGRLVEVGYREPAASLYKPAKDIGAA